MHIKCSKKDLMNSLSMCSMPAISNINNNPIINNLLFLFDNEKLNLISTNLEITIKTDIKAEIIEKGNITIPAKKLIDITKEADENIDIISNENKVNIKFGNSRFSILGMSSDDYPSLPNLELKEDDSDIIFLEKNIFIQMIKKTIYAVSTDRDRFVLNGILLKIENKTLTLVSTDGKRLCVVSSELEKETTNFIEIIIPTKTINELLKILDKINSNILYIKTNDNQVLFKLGDTIFISKVVDGKFPNYKQVIPNNLTKKVILSRLEFLSATKRASIINLDSIKYLFNENKLIVSAISPGVGEIEDELKIDYTQENFEIAYNPRYIMDFLESIDDEKISLELDTSFNPCIIKPLKDDNNYICVIMPMRI